MGRKTYDKRTRAAAEADTRRRITEAAMELHGSVGVARASVTEIARRAGVSRMTVYNHFPDDAALLAACSAHYDTLHPGPDIQRWGSLSDPERRLEPALVELYRYFSANDAMLAGVLGDRHAVPALDAFHSGSTDLFFAAVVDVLAAGWDTRDRRAALCLVTGFWSWRALAAAGLPPAAAARLAARLVTAA